jgi:hypothetical protein
VTRQVIDAIPDDHLGQAMYSNNLGISLGDRYSRTEAIADLEKAIQMVRQAFKLLAHSLLIAYLGRFLGHGSGPPE